MCDGWTSTRARTRRSARSGSAPSGPCWTRCAGAAERLSAAAEAGLVGAEGAWVGRVDEAAAGWTAAIASRPVATLHHMVVVVGVWKRPQDPLGHVSGEVHHALLRDAA